MIHQKAYLFALKMGIDFKASRVWLGRLKRHHIISTLKICDEIAADPEGCVENWLPVLQCILMLYHPQDVYNADETAMFFNLLLEQTIAVMVDAWKFPSHLHEALFDYASLDLLHLNICKESLNEMIITLRVHILNNNFIPLTNSGRFALAFLMGKVLSPDAVADWHHGVLAWHGLRSNCPASTLVPIVTAERALVSHQFWLKNIKSRHDIRELDVEGEKLLSDLVAGSVFKEKFINEAHRDKLASPSTQVAGAKMRKIRSNFEVRFLLPNVTATLQTMDQGVIKKLKRIYIKQLLHRLLLAEKYVKRVVQFIKKLDMKEGIYMHAAARVTLHQKSMHTHSEAFMAAETLMSWLEKQIESTRTHLILLKRIKDLAAKKQITTVVQKSIKDFFKSSNTCGLL
ncbi:hypothetical protein PR048_009021 [Dryococelus australis]|uniref:HTH CENPB-type domain-containing protein n=1 Tax=Dryococelus australis TaxID=614101 RepID=A0ABQ9HZ42_9NEOP|nr:hypothetical protein PR048_009021 [Dryococelus australis]